VVRVADDGRDAVLDAWGDRLAEARLTGGLVGDPPRRLTLAEGYALAARATARWGEAIGWKVGATSAAAQAFLGVDSPIFGRLFAGRVWHDGERCGAPGERDLEAEPEVALRLGRPLAPGDDPLGAVAQAWLAAEIVRPSHPRPFDHGAGFIVADNAAGVGALLGPELPLEALDEPATIEARLSVEDGTETSGNAEAVLGNPLHALAWLAAEAGGLPAGALVLTGAMARAIPVPRGCILRLDGGRWGSARLAC
jgi:2-keto-4-pentenoate hydratase